jgi:RNA polymerase sigma-70 factor (family 1)
MALNSSLTDEALLVSLRAGNEAAFTEIYHRYWQKLFYLAGKKLDDLYEAEGLVQDIFLDLWQRRERLDIQGSLNSYLAVALKYRVINLQAKQDRDAAYVQYAAKHLPRQDESTEQWLGFEELRGRLAALVAALPEKCRIAYQLREMGYSQREIAGHMQISENTVETHIGRALRFLRTGLGYFFSVFFIWLLFLLLSRFFI